MTPNDIEVLLHHYVSPEPHPRAHAPAVRQAQQMWTRQGIFNEDGEVTEQGRVLIEMLCNTPLPIKITQWRDPRG